MYRVLIIDDEEFITNSLATLLENTDNYDMDVYKAYSGSEAIRLLNEIKFDIVISDICMPGITGIELAKIIREKWPLSQVILLTGYDDFKYAQQAIQHKVTRYILKSDGDEALLDAIRECIDLIERDNDMQGTLVKAKEEIRQSKAALRRSLIRTLMLYKNNDPVYRDQAFEQVDISLTINQPVMLLAGKTNCDLNEEKVLALDLILRKKVNYAVKSESVWWKQNIIIWVLQPVERENIQHSQAVIKGTTEIINRTVGQILNLSISFVFHEMLIPWEGVTVPFEELKSIVMKQFDPDPELAMVGVEYFREKNNYTSEKSFINKLMIYIVENLDGDLSLCALSDKLHLNPAYLSRRFKELTGYSLSEVILEERMKAACDLLKNTTIRISDIAQMVGYETSANFSKVFKKELGMTPRDYRDKEGIIK